LILKDQYEKSIETINLIKQYLEKVFTAIDVEPETIEKLSKKRELSDSDYLLFYVCLFFAGSAAITEENMVHFLGILE